MNKNKKKEQAVLRFIRGETTRGVVKITMEEREREKEKGRERNNTVVQKTPTGRVLLFLTCPSISERTRFHAGVAPLIIKKRDKSNNENKTCNH